MGIVKMYHNDPVATAGPVEADVPADGVEMMRRAGWYEKPDDDSGGISFEKMTATQLRAYAEENKIALGVAKSTKDILALVLAAEDEKNKAPGQE